MNRRLALGFVLFAVLIVVVFEVPLGLALASNARTTALTEVQSDATSLGLVISAALQRGDRTDAQGVIDRFARSEHAVVLALSNGRPVLAAGTDAVEELSDATTRAILRTADAGRSAGEEGAHDPDDDFLYAVTPVALRSLGRVGDPSGSVRLVVLVTEPAGPLHRLIRRDDLALGGFGLGVLLVAVVVGALLARSLTRPLARIEATVAAVGGGTLSARVPMQRAPTELRALRDTVNEMAHRLERLVHAQRAFVSDASHQLRTPLTALRLRLENLEGPLVPPEELASAIAETDRLAHVVDELLTLARTEAAQPSLASVDLLASVRARVDAWSPLAAEREVALRVEGGSDSIRALAGPGYLDQVLDNLLDNALEATPAGGMIRLTINRIGDDVDLHVIDTGHGMRADERARAFDRFWRADTSPRGGTGLGLAIVAQLVRASGGTCWLDAAASGGVDAAVRLRVAP